CSGIRTQLFRIRRSAIGAKLGQYAVFRKRTGCPAGQAVDLDAAGAGIDVDNPFHQLHRRRTERCIESKIITLTLSKSCIHRSSFLMEKIRNNLINNQKTDRKICKREYNETIHKKKIKNKEEKT